MNANEFSIQDWLRDINCTLIRVAERLEHPKRRVQQPPVWEMRHRLQESIEVTIVETPDLAAFLAELQDAGVVEAWIRGMIEDRPSPDALEIRYQEGRGEAIADLALATEPPDEAEIHYPDGRIRPLADLISDVERTIPKGEGL